MVAIVGLLFLCGSAGEFECSWEAPGPGVAVTEEDDLGVDRVESGERGECDLAVVVEAVLCDAPSAGYIIEAGHRVAREQDAALLERDPSGARQYALVWG